MRLTDMPKYQLKRRLWDGVTLHPIDSILDLPEGTQPRSAVPFDKVNTEKAEKADDPLLTDEPSLLEAKPGDTLSSLSKKGK